MVRLHALVATIFVVTGTTTADYVVPKQLTVIIPASSAFLATSGPGGPTGYIIDLLNLAMPLAGFTYKLVLQPDDAYGSQLEDGNWNGVVGSLLAGKADVAADLVITASRDRVIDFTTSFLLLGTRILVNVADANIDAQSGNTSLKYLVVRDTSTQIYLMNSPLPNIKAIWANVQANNGLVNNYKDGVDKVAATPGFAIIADTAFLKKYKDMHAVQVVYAPGVLVFNGLAFGVPQGSLIRDPLSIAIEMLNDSGDITALAVKYGIDKVE